MSDLSPYIPEDFDEFWEETVQEAENHPLDFKRSGSNDFSLPGFVVETFRFTGVGGRSLNGWIAYEPGALSAPAFLWPPPYGRESLLPNEYGTRKGFVSLSLNFFGEPAFHQEKYRMERGYFAEGGDDPSHWVFRKIFQDAYVAVRILQELKEVNPEKVGAMGMSQGAGISIWLGAWCQHVRAVAADMPFLCAVRQTLLKTVHRYPLKELTDFMHSIPLGEERVINTVAHFDTVNMATRCAIPTQVTAGLRDPACRPDNVRACFDALIGEKTITELDWGHDWHPSMVDRNRDWLLQHL